MITRHDLEQAHNIVQTYYDPQNGYPVGNSLYYECPKCFTFMKSSPSNYDEARCACRFIAIDIDWGRLVVSDQHHQPKLYDVKLRNF